MSFKRNLHASNLLSFSTIACLILLLVTGVNVAQAKPIKIGSLPAFQNQKALCEYLSEKKAYAESMMRRSYKPNQYDRLEAKRKYWKNLYVEHCFD